VRWRGDGEGRAGQGRAGQGRGMGGEEDRWATFSLPAPLYHPIPSHIDCWIKHTMHQFTTWDTL
jgi:hypothetical protein